LDLKQCNFTLDNRELMREILWALIEDATRQAGLVECSIRDGDGQRSVKQTRNAARACSNVRANAAAAALSTINHSAASGQFEACRVSLEGLRREIERLKEEAEKL